MATKGSPLDNLAKLFKPLFQSRQSRELEVVDKRRRILYLKRKYSNSDSGFTTPTTKKRKEKE